MQELLDTAKLPVPQPLPIGGQIAIISNSGEPGHRRQLDLNPVIGQRGPYRRPGPAGPRRATAAPTAPQPPPRRRLR
ncbi:hypothetical protein [Nonomuraea sp. NPDC046570]|uniref:hypothetical protein n=1 Tax=Nonomuraea sp. NPDC046570 TaxID=3155255 RepID=UPI0033EB3EA9